MPDTTTQLRRRNHFVAATYLSTFTPERSRDGTLWRYDRRAPRSPRDLRVDSVGLERDLYIRPDRDGQPSDAVERFLAEEIEAPFARIRNYLVDGAQLGLIPSMRALNNDERHDLSRFVAFQIMRGPTERDATRWMGRLSSALELERQLAADGDFHRQLAEVTGAPLTAEQRETWKGAVSRLSIFAAQADDWLPRTIRIAERIAGLLATLTWYLVPVPDGIELVTCDVPVVRARRGRRLGTYTLGCAVADPAFEATFPLSPRHLLYITQRAPDLAYLQTPAFARSVRVRTVEYAHRWVFSRTRDREITQVLRSSPAPTYYAEVAGRRFPVGSPIDVVERHIRELDVDAFGFDYGPL